MKTKTKKHWYFTKTVECVLCGHCQTERIRKLGKKPKNPNKRYAYEQTACGEHFL